MRIVVKKGKDGSLIANYYGVFLVFDRHEPQPMVGQRVDAMITHQLRGKDGAFNAFVVRQVTDEDFLVRHTGFSIRQDGVRAAAMIYQDDRAKIAREVGVTVNLLTPGQTPVLKSRVTPDGTIQLLRPGHAYIAKSDLRNGLSKICGLPTLDDVNTNLIGKPARVSQVSISRAITYFY